MLTNFVHACSSSAILPHVKNTLNHLLVLVWAHSYYSPYLEAHSNLIAISYCIYSYNVGKVPVVGYVAFQSIGGNKMGHQEALF